MTAADLRDSVKSGNSVCSFKSYITADNNDQEADLAVDTYNAATDFRQE